MDATGIFLGRPDERRTRARRTACLTVTVSTYERWGGDCRQHACFRWQAVRLPESNLGFINPAVPGFFVYKRTVEHENRIARRGRIEQESRRESEGLKERVRNPILVQGDGSAEPKISYSVFLLRTLS